MMTKYALIEQNAVCEIFETDSDIADLFHPALTWVPCDDNVEVGSGYSNGEFSAPDPVASVNPNDAINAQIAAMEAAVFLNRGSRELEMRLIEQASGGNADVLAAQPYYVKLKALDDQIRALRAQLT